MNICTKCETENDDKAHFCHNCASPLQAKRCPSGLHWMDPKLEVCPQCASSNLGDQNEKPPLAFQLASVKKNSVVTINPFGICRDLTLLHSGRVFDVYQAKLENTTVCLKTPKPPRTDAENQRAETATYECFENRCSRSL
jgi:hypothetical protein